MNERTLFDAWSFLANRPAVLQLVESERQIRPHAHPPIEGFSPDPNRLTGFINALRTLDVVNQKTLTFDQANLLALKDDEEASIGQKFTMSDEDFLTNLKWYRPKTNYRMYANHSITMIQQSLQSIIQVRSRDTRLK